MKVIPIVIVLTLIVAVAYAVKAQEYPVYCEDELCVIRKSDLEKVQHLINALVQRVQELQDRKCS